MKRIGLFVMLSVLYVTGFVFYLGRLPIRYMKSVEETRLADAVDFASDAAVQAMLDSKDLNMDYTDITRLEADPQLALDTFVDILLKNYDMPTSTANRQQVKASMIPVFVVAVTDGYFMATPTLMRSATDYPENPIKDGDWNLVFKPKMPYKYTDGGVAYALSMSAESALRLQGNQLTKLTSLPPGLGTKDAVRREITKTVSSNISYAIDKLNEGKEEWANTFYMPGDLTSLSQTNPLKGPSVIAIVQNVDFNSVRPIGSFSVAGSNIDLVKYVLGYERLGIKYYSYSDNLPVGVTVENVYRDAKAAALAGYAADVEYLK